jgi:hypothetical protein
MAIHADYLYEALDHRKETITTITKRLRLLQRKGLEFDAIAPTSGS